MSSGESRRRRLVKNLALLLITCSLCFAGLEVLFRVSLEWKFSRRVARDENPLYRFEPGNPIEYALHPGVQRDQMIEGSGVEWTYRINGSGFRGIDLLPRDASTRRVLCIGDSYTFGWGVPEEEAYPAQLHETLRASRPELDSQVYNLGVPGYNTVQEFHLLRQQSERYEPDLVILGFVMNDGEPQANMWRDPQRRYRFVNSWVLAELRHQVNQRLFDGEPRLRTGLDLHEPYHLTDRYLRPMLEGSRKWEATRKAFFEMAAWCAEQDIPLLVVIFPDFTQPFDEEYAYGPIHEEVLDWSRQNEVNVIDLFHGFFGRDHRSFQVPGDGHPNGEAFGRIVDEILPTVERILGPPLPLEPEGRD
ncbi:hypothetical protein ABI59_20675 [Acidobacteria bacterium Mor1]|nr:hypothetical protein ABI59_20675 [Acidobacteria bacterium Mor1]